MDLFVYGTLMRSSTNRMSQRLHARSEWLGPDACRGELYDLGAYPALILPGATWVCGECVAVEAADLVWLDAYEGSEYERLLCPLRSGRQAWAYVYRVSLPETARHVLSGSWQAT